MVEGGGSRKTEEQVQSPTVEENTACSGKLVEVWRDSLITQAG